MQDQILQIMLGVVASIFENITAPIREGVLSMFGYLFESGSESLAGLFQNPMIVALTTITDMFCWICFTVALLFFFLKVVQEERRNWGVILLCPIKTIFFVITYKYIVQVCYLLPCYILAGFRYIPGIDMTLDADMFFGSVSDSLGKLLFGPISQITLVVALIGFSCVAIMRMGSMVIQVLSAPFYVPYVLMGDFQKLMEWVVSTVSVGFTFVVQYIVFYSGMVILQYSKDGVLGAVIGISLLFSTFVVPRQMQKFGWASGAGHALQTTAYSGNMLVSSVRTFVR